jgi:hypothetical protein
LLEEERSIVSVRDVSKWAIGNEGFSVVKLGSTWYLGVQTSSQVFRLFVIEGDRMELLRDFPLRVPGAPSSRPTTLIRNTRGDALAIWSRALGWYIHPLELRGGQAEEPFELTPRALADVPRVCEDDEDGWLIVEKPPVSMHVDFNEPKLKALDVEARLVVSPLSLCTDALAGRADGSVTNLRRALPPPAMKTPIPLTLTDRGPSGRRWGFTCSH